MLRYARVICAVTLVLTTCTGCVQITIADEYPGNGRRDATPAFASESTFLDGSNESYGRRASVEYPEDPSGHFSRIRAAREMLRIGDCKSAVPTLSDEQIAARIDLFIGALGSGYLTPPLLRTLIHFDASPEKARLFAIIGRNTFSASHNMIVDLDWVAEPVFVGEPSGSRPGP